MHTLAVGSIVAVSFLRLNLLASCKPRLANSELVDDTRVTKVSPSSGEIGIGLKSFLSWADKLLGLPTVASPHSKPTRRPASQGGTGERKYLPRDPGCSQGKRRGHRKASIFNVVKLHPSQYTTSDTQFEYILVFIAYSLRIRT